MERHQNYPNYPKRWGKLRNSEHQLQLQTVKNRRNNQKGRQNGPKTAENREK
jgi:hypothetical protein